MTPFFDPKKILSTLKLGCLLFAILSLGCEVDSLSTVVSETQIKPKPASDVASVTPPQSLAEAVAPPKVQLADQLSNRSSEDGESESNVASIVLDEKQYSDAELHKNLTTMLLADQPDIRARRLLRFARGQLTSEEWDRGLQLILQHDSQFQRLSEKRRNILNEAVDADDTAQKLRQIKIETIELSGRMRALVKNAILIPKQEEERRKATEESRMAQQVEAGRIIR